MLGIDERGDTTSALCIRDDVETQRRLTARLGAVDLGDSTTRNSANSDRRIEVDRAGGNRINADARRLGAHLHDRSLAAALLDLRDGQVQRFLAIVLRS